MLNLKRLFVLFLLIFSGESKAAELAPFTSDGCSSFPDGTLEHNDLWLECCVAHDYAYWRGGSYRERLEADKALDECVAQVGEPAIALIMLAGVRVGGSPFFPTSFRWGYGWPYPRFYGDLTKMELEQVERANKSVSIQQNDQRLLEDRDDAR